MLNAQDTSGPAPTASAYDKATKTSNNKTESDNDIHSNNLMWTQYIRFTSYTPDDLIPSCAWQMLKNTVGRFRKKAKTKHI
jgi:hypothetical protein